MCLRAVLLVLLLLGSSSSQPLWEEEEQPRADYLLQTEGNAVDAGDFERLRQQQKEQQEKQLQHEQEELNARLRRAEYEPHLGVTEPEVASSQRTPAARYQHYKPRRAHNKLVDMAGLGAEVDVLQDVLQVVAHPIARRAASAGKGVGTKVPILSYPCCSLMLTIPFLRATSLSARRSVFAFDIGFCFGVALASSYAQEAAREASSRISATAARVGSSVSDTVTHTADAARRAAQKQVSS